MKASTSQQESLLALFELDLSIARVQKEAGHLEQGQQLVDLRRELALANTELAQLVHQVEQTEIELKRAEQDLELVEKRIALDRERLNHTSSSKDAQGMQSELESLAKRKSDLEDIELAILERQESEQSSLGVAKQRRDEIAAKLEAETAAIAKRLAELAAQLAELNRQRAQATAGLPAELVGDYERLLGRGVPVGRLKGRDCQACQLSLSAADYAKVVDLDSEEVAHCPDCGAILIRS